MTPPAPGRADLVLEGGGAKGLGLVGAWARLAQAGWAFERVAGTSAGAIVGAFVASGARPDAVVAAMDRLDWSRITDRGAPGLPLVSEGLSLLTHRGAYRGDYVHTYVRDELARLGVRTFGDLRRDDPGDDTSDAGAGAGRYRLVVTATDVTTGRLLRLPWDYPLLGLDPDEQLVADAVRASMSIPLFFEPVTIHDHVQGRDLTLVDGGVLSVFPLDTFDRRDGAAPRWPTLGVQILPVLPDHDAELLPLLGLPALPPVRLLEQVVATALFGRDQTVLARPCVRSTTMEVDTGDVGAVDFSLSPEQRAGLLAAGRTAAEGFLARWDWPAWLARCGARRAG